MSTPAASPLSANEVTLSLNVVPEWKLSNGEITRTYVFKSFQGAMDFVNAVAAFAEEAGHHPDIDIRYNKVRLGLVSHDAGGITAKDFALAKKVDNWR